MKLASTTSAVLVLALLCGCSVIGGGGGSGVDSPFFSDAETRTTGTLDGYVLAPVTSTGGISSLMLSPCPGTPGLWRPADSVRVELAGGAFRTTDARGFYSFDSLSPGRYSLEASDTTGAYAPVIAEVDIRAGAITSAPDDPVDPPEVRSAEYFAVGAEDVIRFRSVRGTREWRRSLVTEADDAGVYRFSFVAPGGVQTDEYTDLSFGDTGVLWHGGEWGTLSPAVPWLPEVMRVGDSFNQSTTLVDPDGESESSATVTSTLVGVDDLVLPAGRFENCPKLEVTLEADDLDIDRTIWLAYRVGPVKMILDDVDHQAEFGTIGGVEYP